MTSSMQWSSHRFIYQWIDSSISSCAINESALMIHLIVSLLQRQTMIDLLIELINEWNKLYYVVNLNQKWVCFNNTVSSMQWSSHHSIYQWIDSSISSHATSESASKTSSMRWFSHHFTYQWIDSPISLHATS